MFYGIHPQILHLSARQYIQHTFAFEVVNARVIGVAFLYGKVIDSQNQSFHFSRFFPDAFIDLLTFRWNRLVMHALYGTGWRLLHPGAVRSRGTKSLFDGMGAKKLAVTLLESDEFLRPTKPDFAAGTIHPDGCILQIGFLLEYTKMTDDPHVVGSFTNNRLDGSAAWTALLVVYGTGFQMKFFRINGQDLANL
nr:hypothetical protein [Paenibacillus herberti]